jgi:hypothetical protein
MVDITRLLAAPAAGLACFLYLLLGGANPLCVMTVASGPVMGKGYAIGGIPPPVQRVPCPPAFLARWNGYVVNAVPEGTNVEFHGLPCAPGF